MNKEKVIEKLQVFAELARQTVDVREIIFYGAWQKGLAKADDEIEVAVVVDRLGPDDDFIECRERLDNLAVSVDKRIEATLIERKKGDLMGFYGNLQKNGMFIFKA